MKKFAVALILVVSFAAEAKEAKKKPVPQVAGMGLAPAAIIAKHGCTVSYDSCMAGCNSASGASCVQECASDCNVCALDTGEESSSVCSK